MPYPSPSQPPAPGEFASTVLMDLMGSRSADRHLNLLFVTEMH
jgi:hypothetical protein